MQYGEQCDSLSPWSQAVLCSMVSSVIHCLSIISMVSGGFVQYGEQCDSLSLYHLHGLRWFCAVW